MEDSILFFRQETILTTAVIIEFKVHTCLLRVKRRQLPKHVLCAQAGIRNVISNMPLFYTKQIYHTLKNWNTEAKTFAYTQHREEYEAGRARCGVISVVALLSQTRTPIASSFYLPTQRFTDLLHIEFWVFMCFHCRIIVGFKGYLRNKSTVNWNTKLWGLSLYFDWGRSGLWRSALDVGVEASESAEFIRLMNKKKNMMSPAI